VGLQNQVRDFNGLARNPIGLCLPVNKAADSGADTCSAPEFASPRVAKESIAPIKFEPLATGATRSIALGTFRLRRNLRRLPMKSSFRLFADPHAMLKRNCVSQVMISLSALASTAIS
jgi:hypothetical protein